MYEEQKGICVLTGIEMTTSTGNKRVQTNLSIDRIDSSKDYIKGNVQLVCLWANIAKNDLKQDPFIEFCKKVSTKFN